MGNNELREWIFEKWALLDKKHDKRLTQKELTAIIDLDNSLLSKYLAGKAVPEGDSVEKLARLDPTDHRLYKILGIENGDPDFNRIREIYSDIPPEKLGDLIQVVEQFWEQNGLRRDR